MDNVLNYYGVSRLIYGKRRRCYQCNVMIERNEYYIWCYPFRRMRYFHSKCFKGFIKDEIINLRKLVKSLATEIKRLSQKNIPYPSEKNEEEKLLLE